MKFLGSRMFPNSHVCEFRELQAKLCSWYCLLASQHATFFSMNSTPDPVHWEPGRWLCDNWGWLARRSSEISEWESQNNSQLGPKVSPFRNNFLSYWTWVSNSVQRFAERWSRLVRCLALCTASRLVTFCSELERWVLLYTAHMLRKIAPQLHYCFASSYSLLLEHIQSLFAQGFLMKTTKW
jgi:hypothetical protein